VEFRIPNTKIETNENRELDNSRPQATGQEAIGSQYKDRNLGKNTRARNLDS
jgi:hypothetical protein